MFFHPGNQLVGMVCFLDSVFGKYRLEAFVLAQRVTQTERLRKFARLMNELMDPLQIVGSVGPGKVGKKRALAKLRSVVLRGIKQPLHEFSSFSKQLSALALRQEARPLAKQTRQEQVTA
jgi:hypothetical protein